MRLSDQVAEAFLARYPAAGLVGYRTGRNHIVKDGYAKCGSFLSPRVESRVVTRQQALLPTTDWCYSCVGNALEEMERGEV